MSQEDSSWSFAAGLFVGALGGAALASLFTPRSGQQSREAVREKGLVLKARVDQVTGSARGSATAATSSVKDTANAAVERVSTTVQTVKERVGETAERVTETASQVAERVSEVASEAAHRGQEVIETVVEQAQVAIDTATEKGRQVVQTVSDKTQQASSDTGAPTEDLADHVAITTDVGTDQSGFAAERSAGRAEEAIDYGTDTTLSTADRTDAALDPLADEMLVGDVTIDPLVDATASTDTIETTVVIVDDTLDQGSISDPSVPQSLTEPLDVNSPAFDTTVSGDPDVTDEIIERLERELDEDADDTGNTGRV